MLKASNRGHQHAHFLRVGECEAVWERGQSMKEIERRSRGTEFFFARFAAFRSSKPKPGLLGAAARLKPMISPS